MRFNLILFSIFFLILNLNFVLAYDWNFSNSDDYIFNSTEIIVSGGNAYLNSSSLSTYAWWHLNELTGNNAFDSSGNNRNGTLTNMENSDWVAGKLNNALLFDGVNEYIDCGNIDCGNIAGFERNNTFSFETWFLTNTTTQKLILSKASSSGHYTGYQLYFLNGKIYFDLINSYANLNYISKRTVNNYNDSLFHHLVVTYDGSSLASGIFIYIDGNLTSMIIVRDTLANNINNTVTFRIGSLGTGNCFIGELDEVIIYDRVLSPSDVTFKYNGGMGTENPFLNYLTGYYTIQPKNNFSYSNILLMFSENATKIGSEIKYSITTNGTWQYWNNTNWATSNENWTQSNLASDISSHINTLGSSGNFTFKAILHSDDGTYTPYLDNIEVDICSENWQQINSSCGYYCGIWDKYQLTYTDTNLCGTNTTLPLNNGTCYDCDYCMPTFECSLFNATCYGNPPTNYKCLQANDTTTCCQTTNLSSDCIYTGNLSDFDINYAFDIFTNSSLIVPSYPYIDFNTSYNIKLSVPTNNMSDIKLYLTNPTNNLSVFNLSFISGNYQITLIFTEEGNYPFVINGTNPCSTLTGNIYGTFKIRKPFYIIINAFKDKNTSIFISNKYLNDFAYTTAELTGEQKFSQGNYDTNMETFLTPLLFKNTFKKSVFYDNYYNGQSTLKLYEKNQEYAFRLFDGSMTFNGNYAVPNISKTYGTNIYLGKYYLNGTDETFNFYLSNKDIYPYKYLFNWIFIIGLFMLIILSAFLFFIIPTYPLIAFSLGVGGTIMLIIFRIVIWLYWG